MEQPWSASTGQQGGTGSCKSLENQRAAMMDACGTPRIGRIPICLRAGVSEGGLIEPWSDTTMGHLHRHTRGQAESGRTTTDQWIYAYRAALAGWINGRLCGNHKATVNNLLMYQILSERNHFLLITVTITLLKHNALCEPVCIHTCCAWIGKHCKKYIVII